MEAFFKQELVPLNDVKIEEIRAYTVDNKQAIKHGLSQSLSEIMQRIISYQSKGTLGPVKYIVFSMLRSSVLDKSYKIRVTVYDALFYAGLKDCYEYYDCSWLFKTMDDIVNYITNIKNNKLKNYQIEFLELKQFSRYVDIFINFMRYVADIIEDVPNFFDIDKESELELRVGEYFDLTTPVYTYFKNGQDEHNVKVKFEAGGIFAFKTYNNLDLSRGMYDGVTIKYCNFRKCNFSSSSFRKGNLQGSIFIDCNFDRVDFNEADLSFVDFVDVDLSTANFKFANTEGTIN